MKMFSACRNIIILTALLCLPYLMLSYLNVPARLSGQIGIALLFFVTGLTHFRQPSALGEMIPNWVPSKSLVVSATGVFELLGAIAILIPSSSRITGWALSIFLVLVLPANIYAAFKRVDFGGHSLGPAYLLLRIPFQLFLLGWIRWFSGS
jgi:uncharacterized membrane protein